MSFSLWGRKGSDMTEVTEHARMHNIGQEVEVGLTSLGSLPVGGVVLVACQGFLVRAACVSVLVGGPGFLLSGVQ